MSEIDPARLDELLAGDLPRTDEERDLLHMAAALREAAPEVPDHLRDRIMSMASDAPARAGRRWPRLSPAAWLGPAAAGIAAVVIGAAVVLPGITGGDTVQTPSPEALDSRVAAPEGTRGAPAPSAATPAMSPTELAGPEAAPVPPATSQAPSAAGAPIVLLSPAGDDWPAGALEVVAAPVRANGGVLTDATVGTAADGREDLRIEMLIPAGAQDQAAAAIREALPADGGWAPSEAARAPVDKSATGDLLRPDAAPKELAGPDPAQLSVVVVRGDAP